MCYRKKIIIVPRNNEKCFKLSWLLFIFRTQTMYKAQAEAEKIKVQKLFFFPWYSKLPYNSWKNIKFISLKVCDHHQSLMG